MQREAEVLSRRQLFGPIPWTSILHSDGLGSMHRFGENYTEQRPAMDQNRALMPNTGPCWSMSNS